MKAKSITYSRLASLGNFENVKIEIEVEIEDGENAEIAYQKAKLFVDGKIKENKNPNNLPF